MYGVAIESTTWNVQSHLINLSSSRARTKVLKPGRWWRGGGGLTYHFVLCFPYAPRGKRLACMHACSAKLYIDIDGIFLSKPGQPATLAIPVCVAKRAKPMAAMWESSHRAGNTHVASRG